MTVARLVRAVTATVFSAALFVIGTSCGETYRPVAYPIPPSSPNPGANNSVFVLSDNGNNDPGMMSRIDVSGDSYLNAVNLGLSPVHAALTTNGANIYTANNADNTVSANGISATGTVTTISLPTGSDPVFVATAESAHIYVANYGLGTVSAISTLNNVISTAISVNPTFLNNPTTPDTTSQPVALAETPNGNKLYVANWNSGANGYVTSINTVDYSRNPPIPIGGTPIAVAARSDSTAVFALDSTSGNLYSIDPTLSPEPTPKSVATSPGADFMLYDNKLNRLYVLKSGFTAATANSGGNGLWVFDASISPTINPPALLAGPISIQPIPGSPCGSGTPVPVSVAALPDESRIYVGSYQISGTTICTQVSVFTTSNYALSSTIATGSGTIDATNPTGCTTARPAPPGPTGPLGYRLSLAPSADLPSTRVYLSSCDLGGTVIITTVPIAAVGSQPAQAADTVASELPAPESGFPAVGGALPPPQNPMFILSQ